MGILYVVATPVGNIEDMTLRAIRILKEVGLILCENTSESHKLFKYYDITTATTNYYSNSRIDKIDKIISMLESGQNLALVSDAGTPCISDPGSLLIHSINMYNDKLRASSADNNGEQIRIIPIPGATAITALYSVSGIVGNRFTFLGFIPQKKGRETFIRHIFEYLDSEEIPIIFYESVHRIEKFFEQFIVEENRRQDKQVSENVNDKKKIKSVKYEIIIGRELSKMYEEIIRGSAMELFDYYKENKDKIRGEFTIIVNRVEL